MNTFERGADAPSMHAPTNMREPMTHTLRISTMSTKGIATTFFCYLVLFMIAIILGATGPDIMHKEEFSEDCKPGKNCTWKQDIKGYSPMSQVLWIEGRLERPDNSGENAADISVTFPLNYKLEATGDGKTLTKDNAIHSHETHCAPKADFCDVVILFSVPYVHHSKYHFEIKLIDPLGDLPSGIKAKKSLEFKLEVKSVNTKYTQFEAGWKYFFATATLILSITYMCVLRSVPRRARSFEQPWMIALLIMLFWFNDPFFAAALQSPGFAWPGIYVFLSISFITLLLLFILCEFDVVRQATVMRINNTGLIERGATFWVPKSILMTAFWVSAVALGMSLLFRLDQNPAFNLWDDDGIFRYLFVFTAVVAGIYAIWVLVFIVINLGTIQSMSSSSKFIYCLSVVTILIALSIFWAGGIVPGVPNGSLQFLAGYSIINLYTWFMAFATSPDMKTASFDDQLYEERDKMHATEEEEVEMDEVQFSDEESPEQKDGVEERSGGAFAIGGDDDDEDHERKD